MGQVVKNPALSPSSLPGARRGLPGDRSLPLRKVWAGGERAQVARRQRRGGRAACPGTSRSALVCHRGAPAPSNSWGAPHWPQSHLLGTNSASSELEEPQLLGSRHRSITEQSPTSARPPFPRARDTPRGKLAPLRSLAPKYPRPRAEPLPRSLAEPSLPLGFARNPPPPSAVGRLGDAERRAPALFKIEAEQMVGAGCWWRRQPSLFPRQLVAGMLLLAPFINPLDIAGILLQGERGICLLGRCRCLGGLARSPHARVAPGF